MYEANALRGIREAHPTSVIELHEEYRSFVPSAFTSDPFVYFEKYGTNIKPGDIELDAEGNIKEDPTATKEFPAWQDTRQSGKEIHVVAKRVNQEKGEVGRSGDPFHEYEIMKIAEEFDLPAARPIARIKSRQSHMILMEKVEGIPILNDHQSVLEESGFTPEEIRETEQEALRMIEDLKERYAVIGIIREKWKVKDMIFSINEEKKLTAVTPVDWERTKIDQLLLERARERVRVSA